MGDLSPEIDRMPGMRAQITAAIDGVKTGILETNAEVKRIAFEPNILSTWAMPATRYSSACAGTSKRPVQESKSPRPHGACLRTGRPCRRRHVQCADAELSGVEWRLSKARSAGRCLMEAAAA